MKEVDGLTFGSDKDIRAAEGWHADKDLSVILNSPSREKYHLLHLFASGRLKMVAREDFYEYNDTRIKRYDHHACTNEMDLGA